MSSPGQPGGRRPGLGDAVVWAVWLVILMMVVPAIVDGPGRGDTGPGLVSSDPGGP